MKITSTAIFLAVLVIFTFAVRSIFLWRDFIFVYDQGRDALAVQRILGGDLTLIGPTTGLFGVYLGPFFYYLLTPLYWLGQGNPIIPAYAFVLLSSLVVIPVFIFARRIAGVASGIFAALLYSFSFLQWQFGRWLSNPTPLPFFVSVMFLCVLQALKTREKKWHMFAGLLLGLSLQLEAANAVFLIPTLLTIWVVEAFLLEGKRKDRVGNWLANLWDSKANFLLAIVGFAITLLPQAIFEIGHGFIITNSLLTAFQTTHEVTVLGNLDKRSLELFELYARGLFWRAPWRGTVFFTAIIGSLCLLIINRAKLFKSQAFRVVFFWFFIPLFFHLIYTGNHGNFWDYYVIAQYLPLYILIASILLTAVRSRGASRILGLLLIVAVAFGVFFPNTKEWFGLFRPYNERISLSLQLDAIDWVHDKADGHYFGFWAYTPSYQDDVYKYLFAYRNKQGMSLPIEHPENIERMFLIVEDDPGNPKRREQWIKEMSSVGNLVDQAKFGAVSVFEVRRK